MFPLPAQAEAGACRLQESHSSIGLLKTSQQSEFVILSEAKNHIL